MMQSVSVVVSQAVVVVNTIIQANIDASSTMLALVDSTTTMTQEAVVLAQAIAMDTAEVTNMISISIAAITATMIGKQSQSVLLLLNLDPTFPPPSPALPPPSDSSSSSISIQATVFMSFCATIMRDIQFLGEQSEDFKNATDAANCTDCPTAAKAQAVIDKWNKTCGNVALQVTVTAQGTLAANVTTSADVADAMNATAALLQSARNCAVCLSTEVRKNRMKMYKKCITGQGSAEKMTCADYQKKSADLIMKITKRHCKCKRKRSMIAQLMFFQASNQTITNSTATIDTAITNMISMTITITSTVLKASFTNLSNSMKNFRAQLAIYLAMLQNATESAVNSTQISANITIQTASDEVTNSSSALIAQISADADVAPGCQSFGNDTMSVHIKFHLNVQSCQAATDNSTNAVTANNGLHIGLMMKRFKMHMSATDSCLTPYCAVLGIYPNMGACLNAYWLFSSGIATCVNNVNISSTLGALISIFDHYPRLTPAPAPASQKSASTSLLPLAKLKLAHPLAQALTKLALMVTKVQP